MQYKNAAGLFVSGVTLILAGPLVVFIAVMFGTRGAFANGADGFGFLYVMVAGIGGLLGIVGTILLIGSAYRALVKIDALEVSVPAWGREKWPSDPR